MTIEPPSDSLGSTMRERRKQLGLNISAAARVAGLSRGTWHEIETGRRTNPDPATHLRIDKALDWTPGTAQHMQHPTSYPANLPIGRRRAARIVIEVWIEDSNDLPGDDQREGESRG
jgi:transcriptional regulator with XRE-family HTH domain